MPQKAKLKLKKVSGRTSHPKPDGFLKICPKAAEVTLGKDVDGFFVYTNRWRSKSYKDALKIHKKIIDFCESTM
jgi:hypothetical protein